MNLSERYVAVLADPFVKIFHAASIQSLSSLPFLARGVRIVTAVDALFYRSKRFMASNIVNVDVFSRRTDASFIIRTIQLIFFFFCCCPRVLWVLPHVEM
jgi:hypothetical protein